MLELGRSAGSNKKVIKLPQLRERNRNNRKRHRDREMPIYTIIQRQSKVITETFKLKI